MRDPTWFLRGVQSAIFLYASCGPCIDASSRRKRRKAAVKSRKEKEQLRAEDPAAPHQPAPFDINPYWQEEINLGPGPPPRRAKNRSKSKRGTQGVTAPAETHTSAEGGSAETDGGRFDLAKLKNIDLKNLDPAVIRENWHNRFQRRDEEYSSEAESDSSQDDPLVDGFTPSMNLRRSMKKHKSRHSGHISPSANGNSGWPSAHRSRRSRSRHHGTRAPPLNDLHPPVVVTPSPYRADRVWMKEPPPSASFMSGKAGSNVYAISGNGSSPSQQEQPSGRLRSRSSPRVIPASIRQTGQNTVNGEVSDDNTFKPLHAGGNKRLSNNPTTFSNSHMSEPSSSEPKALNHAQSYADSAAGSSFEFHVSSEPGYLRSPRRPTSSATADDSSDPQSSESTPVTTANSSTGHVAIPEPVYDPSRVMATAGGRSGYPQSWTPMLGGISPKVFNPSAATGSLSSGPLLQSENASPLSLSRISTTGSNAAAKQGQRLDVATREHPSKIIRSRTNPNQTSTSRKIIRDRTNHNLLEPLDNGISKADLRQSAEKADPRGRETPLMSLPDFSFSHRLFESSISSPKKMAGLLPSPGIMDQTGTVDTSDLEDGWLWNSRGERKFRNELEARDVRNRWSMDF